MEHTHMTEQKNKSVIIIGGGVAGMAAAQFLGQHHVRVHLVEKSEKLGGNSVEWSCMATDTCRNCGACLGADMVRSVSDLEHVSISVNTEVTTLEKIKEKFRIGLSKPPGKTIEVDKVILASGFTPFTPDGLLGHACQNHKNVITTTQLNSILKNQTLSDHIGKTASPKIGFIQCVGSRNREKGRDYCSQVCCKISMRHIDKLLYLYPEADITMFYMDLQIIGKEMRAAFASLSKNVTLVQGVPGEILDNKMTDKLTLIHENPDAMGRMAHHFDMIVLSVGMQPARNISDTLEILNIKPDDWGFVPPVSDDPGQDILVAGCASGPKDILASREQGQNCAYQVLRNFDIASKGTASGDVAVIGDGPEARQVALAISNHGYIPWIFGEGPSKIQPSPGVNYIPDAHILSVRGLVNDYTIDYRVKGKKHLLAVRAVVVAKPAGYDIARLESDRASDRVFSLETFAETILKNPAKIPEKLVFWLDHSGPEPKASARILLNLAREAAVLKKTVTVFMQKMLVNGMDGQRLYDDARKQGVTFLRVAEPSDIRVEPKPSGISYTLRETSLKSITLSLESDWLIIPGKQYPDHSFLSLAGLLKEKTDIQGYLQSANIRHRLTNSFRKGIFYAGSGHDDIDNHDLNQEILNICAGMAALTNPNIPPESDSVVINEKKCARCLTCLRICPHSAIRINSGTKPHIDPHACFSCGLCVANCPALAIESPDDTDEAILKTVTRGQKIVFACRRSAALAASENVFDETINIIPVPCACRISSGRVLKALLMGVDRIILAGCHEENCQSDRGSREARAIARQICRLTGMDSSKVVWAPIAANEPEKFKQLMI